MEEVIKENIEQEIQVEQESVIINGGTQNYNELSNKPSINNVTLQGNLTTADLGIEEYDDTQIKQDILTLQSNLSTETTNRENADINLQSQIDAITVSSDVVDILGTYADLQSYSTTHIKANDIVKVIQDETHNNAMSYYRWVISENIGSWSYVGSEGPFYTKSESDTLLSTKADITDIPTATSDLYNDSNFVVSTDVSTIWVGTQASYEALTPSNNTLYCIEEE